MALQSSGAISLNEIHIEAGGTSGTLCTINDSDIRGLIGKASGATMSFNEWYGASATSPFQFDTSSPATLNTSAFTMAVESTSAGLVKVATRLNITFNASNIGMTIDDVRFSGNTAGSVGVSSGMSQANVNYSNTDDISSIQARWVLNNIHIDFTNGGYDEQVLAILLVGTASESSGTVRLGASGDSTSFDYTGSWVTITPTRFGGSQSNSQSHMLQVQADSNANELAKTVIKGATGGYIEFQVRVNKSSGASSTFSYRRNYTSSTTAIETSSYLQADD